MEISALNHHVGSTERVFVAHVNDLNDFYLHSDLIRESLGKLGQELYDEYSESLTKPLGINETLNVGDYCACPSESEDWYRGLIRQLDSNGHAIVFKLDYGDVQCIPVQFLRPLQKRFFQLHRLAFHCSLVNLIRPINGWSSDVIEEFRSRLTTTFLFAKFINYNEIRDISEVELTEKNSKIPLNKDFEQYQMQRSILQLNDKLVYKYIPMEILDFTQLYQIRILYYISPSHIYVYLREKINSHTSFQVDLQQAIQNLRAISSPVKYQLVAAQDNHAIWHRAVILDWSTDLLKICVYFTDIGQREYISINNIRPLPEEFQRKPAFAIPCRLHKVCPIDGNQQAGWNSDDPVHDEVNRLMINNVTCKVCAKQDQICYDIEIEIPKVGDLGTFLFGKNLVSRATMNYFQRPNFSSAQAPQPSYARTQLHLSGMSPSRTPQQQQQRPTQQNDRYNSSSNTVQQSQTRTSTNAGSSLNISNVPIQNGYYTITQVHSAIEFYGVPHTREGELETLSKYLEDYYNSINDQSLSVSLYVEGSLHVIQQADKYHRVVIKHRESDTRVLVKLIDRGDEIIVDTSELLQIDKQRSAIPAFAQSFRLHGYDESQSSANITRVLKKLICNQRVRIEQQGGMLNGFYPVEVILNDNQYVTQLLLSNDKNALAKSPIKNTRPSFNPTQYPHVESQVFNNSTKHRPTMGHDSSGRFNMSQRTNDDLPAPQKILTGAARTQPGRFGGGNQAFSAASSSNEQVPRIANRNQQQQPQTVESTSSNSMWNNDQYVKPSFGGNNMANQPSFNRQQSGSAQFGANQRTDDDKISMTNNSNRFASTNNDNQPSSFGQKRSSGSGYAYDERSEKQTSGNTFQQNNDGGNESGFRRGGFSSRGGGDTGDRGSGFSNRGRGGDFGDRRGGFSNPGRGGDSGDRGGGFSNRGRGGDFGDRGNGFSDRGGHSGFSNRNMGRNNEDNNNENSSQSSGGFPRRPGGFNDRGGRGGNFQDRNQGDDHNENNMQRSQNFNGNRGEFHGGRGGGGGGFQNRRDQGNNAESGDFERRGGRGGGQRGSGFDSGRGGRGGFRDRDNSGIQLSSDNNSSTKTGNSWSSMRPSTVNFVAGDRFIENEIPKAAFEFVVSHIETANDFFIQLLSKGDELTKSSEILQTEYKQSPETNINAFKINQPCLAKNSDGCWYRAIVLSTGLTKLKVRFIDFGDTYDVDSNTIRQISKTHCSAAPYAYRCTFKNAEAVQNVSTDSIVNNCAGKNFNGKITNKTSDDKFILESDDLRKLLLETNAIKLKSEVTFKRVKCLIAHIESEQQLFYIQDDEDTLEKIAELVKNEDATAPTLSIDEVKQLETNRVVIAYYEDEPFRAIIQSDESDENINVCYVDYGNTSSCPKTSLKRCSEQLSLYPHQSKQCHLYGISSNEITNALKYLEEHSDSETIEIAIVNEKDRVNNVLVYVDNECINEKFGYDPNLIDNHDTSTENEDQSSTTTATTVKEQEQSVSVTEKSTNDDVVPTNESTSAVTDSEKNEPEIEETSPKYRLGHLTHIEKTKPYVYLQLIPESNVIIQQINKLIETITVENKRNPSYEISDHVIAQFSEDDDYYRARIESYSTSSQLYTVYFLDYGNIDENVPIERLYTYSDDLKEIEPQAHGYLLDGITSETWTDIVRSLVEEKLNDTIEFYISNENNSTIHMKFDYENDICNTKENTEQINSSTIEQLKTFPANISATEHDCFYIHISPDGNLHACEMDETLQTCGKEHKDQWSINDLCFVPNEQNQYYRGQILAIDDHKYNVKCIDYGNTLQNISDEHLYVLPDEEIFKQAPLAHQCRLYGVDDRLQTKAIEDVIKHIQPTEHVTITIENDQDDQCLFVTLVRENNEIVNNQYLCDSNDIIENENKQESDNDEKAEIILPNSSDSVIPADVDTTKNTDEQSTTEMNVPQTEHTNEASDTVNTTENTSVSNNQTIDFGENDPSTTVKDETNNSISSN